MRPKVEGISTQYPTATRETETSLQQILRLDSTAHPGLSEVEFGSLFMQCRQCRWIMTRRSFRFHVCSSRREIIDLTLDDNDD